MKIQFQTVIDLKSASRIVLNNGFLLCVGVKLAKPMVKDYYAGELGLDGHKPTDVIKVYTSADTLFSQAVMMGFDGADVVMSHPKGNQVTSDNYKEHIIGTAKQVRQDDGYLVADLVIKDKWAIGAIQEHDIKQISLGYLAQLDNTAGMTDTGQAFDGQWVNMVADHVAVVKAGRCGDDCAIGDELAGNQLTNEQINQSTNQSTNQLINQQEGFMKVTINGIEFDVADAPLAQAINQQTDELTRLRQGKIKVGDTAFGLTESKAVQATIDKLVGDNKALISENERLKANQIQPEDIDKLVAERVKTIDDAKKINPHVITDGKTAQAIKTEVVTAKANDKLVQAIVGDVKTAEQSIIDTAFKALVAVMDSGADIKPVPHATDTALQSLNNIGDEKANQPFDKTKMWQNA